MSKEYEELVEEIAREIEGYGDVEFDYVTHTETAVSSETLAQRIITHISRAVLSGEYPELDKILGVVGRDEVVSILYGGMQTAQGLDLQVRRGDTLIAFRKEGTT